MAIRFNGTSDALGITAPANILNDIPVATIMAWCRPRNIGSSPTVFAASIGPPPGISGSSRLSIDRQSGGVFAGNTSATNPKVLSIGANEDFLSGFWSGDIEDCRIYHRQLPQEIETIVNSKGRDGIVSGLQVRYPLLDGAIGTNVNLCANVVMNSNSQTVGPISVRNGSPQFIDGIISGPRSRSSIASGYQE